VRFSGSRPFFALLIDSPFNRYYRCCLLREATALRPRHRHDVFLARACIPPKSPALNKGVKRPFAKAVLSPFLDLLHMERRQTGELSYPNRQVHPPRYDIETTHICSGTSSTASSNSTQTTPIAPLTRHLPRSGPTHGASTKTSVSPARGSGPVARGATVIAKRSTRSRPRPKSTD
jgi:hypothetical protein